MSRVFAMIAAFSAVVLSTVSASADNGRYFSAMDLAIEHFNADGSKELKAWGPEHTLMLKALDAVAKMYPAVAEASKQSAHFAEKRYSSLAIAFDKSAMKTAAATDLVNRHRSLIDGCGFRRETKIEEQDLGYAKPSITHEVTTIYSLDGRGKKKCTSPAVQLLSKYGLNEVMVRDNNGNLDFAIQAGGNVVQDMRYVKTELLKNGSVDTELIAALNPPPVQQVIGGSSDITLVNSSGKAALTDSITLKYFIGSGDCPAGCITKTYLTFEVRPRTGVGTMNPTFDIRAL